MVPNHSPITPGTATSQNVASQNGPSGNVTVSESNDRKTERHGRTTRLNGAETTVPDPPSDDGASVYPARLTPAGPNPRKPETVHNVSPDPISQAPHAMWYVRPPSGGQFGPASADVLRRWIAEGRVTDDSLVWREGWANWLSACDALHVPRHVNADAPKVEPHVQAEQPENTPAVVVHDDLTALRMSRRIPRTSKSTARTVAVVAVLGLVSLGLLVGLVQVILSR